MYVKPLQERTIDQVLIKMILFDCTRAYLLKRKEENSYKAGAPNNDSPSSSEEKFMFDSNAVA